MRGERPDHTLQATALLNEAYLRLFEGGPFQWKYRKHLFCVVAQSMRRILVDHARSHRAKKLGAEQRKVSLDEAFVMSEEKSPQLLVLNDALENLRKT
jgi:RNA polymerase sigma factor (TIGR02999 family)